MTDRVAELEARTRALLASDRVTAPTRRVLTARLAPLGDREGVLSPRQLEVLGAVAVRLVPLGDLQGRVDLARRLDAELATGPGDGWRYAELPADAPAVKAGLDALDRGAAPDRFTALAADEQDALLQRAQSGSSPDWPVSSARWFEEVVAALARLAYAHPLIQVDIGYDGMADAHGFPDLDAPAR